MIPQSADGDSPCLVDWAEEWAGLVEASDFEACRHGPAAAGGKGRAALAAALPVTVRFEPGDGDLPAASLRSHEGVAGGDVGTQHQVTENMEHENYGGQAIPWSCRANNLCGYDEGLGAAVKRPPGPIVTVTAELAVERRVSMPVGTSASTERASDARRF